MLHYKKLFTFFNKAFTYFCFRDIIERMFDFFFLKTGRDYMERAILHCDLNNFYASVECRDFPHLKGKAVAVCGRQEERHGIVLAKKELAKQY